MVYNLPNHDDLPSLDDAKRPCANPHHSLIEQHRKNISSLKTIGCRNMISNRLQRQAGACSQFRPFHWKIHYLAADLKAWRRKKPKLTHQLQQIESVSTTSSTTTTYAESLSPKSVNLSTSKHVVQTKNLPSPRFGLSKVTKIHISFINQY